jgi:hypothetical protein
MYSMYAWIPQVVSLVIASQQKFYKILCPTYPKENKLYILPLRLKHIIMYSCQY